MFAVEAYDVEPDIMTMAKGIASGFPLGAFIAREDIADAFEPGDHMSTFGGNPVSCAAGVATIDMLVEEQLPERAARLGSMVMSRLDAFAVESDLIGDVRGTGLMIGVELVRNRETKEPASSRGRCGQAALSRARRPHRRRWDLRQRRPRATAAGHRRGGARPRACA